MSDQETNKQHILKNIKELRKKGFLRHGEIKDFLVRHLLSPDNNISRAAGRTIIEEVLGSENSPLRLKALAILKDKNLIQFNPPSPYYGQIDLHSHDCHSDGYQTPTALILEAYEKGLAGIAITNHNQPSFDNEAEEAAKILPLTYFRGSENTVRLTDQANSPSIHVVQLFTRQLSPEEWKETMLLYFQSRSNKRDRIEGTDIDLHTLSALDPEELKKYMEWQRLMMVKNQALESMRNYNQKYGNRWKLSIEEDDLEYAKRGDIFEAYTVVVAIWKKYGSEFLRGIKLEDNGPRKKILKMNDIYEFMLRGEVMSSANHILYPTLDEIALGATMWGSRIILPHPNELSKNVFTEVLERLALVKVEEDGVIKHYVNACIGLEFYTHKIKGAFKEKLKSYIEWLNDQHPVYKRYPLLLLPGSDSHGKFLPDRPLGFKGDYPEARDEYSRKVIAAINQKPKELSEKEQEEIQDDYQNWRKSRHVYHK